jgi:hypothetical protein
MEGHRRTDKDLTGPASPSARATNRQIEVKKEDLDSDSGLSSLSLVNEHIQRNILVCALCKQLYTQPKVGQARIMLKHTMYNCPLAATALSAHILYCLSVELVP